MDMGWDGYRWRCATSKMGIEDLSNRFDQQLLCNKSISTSGWVLMWTQHSTE
jgi:hypothetical protein